MSHILKKRLDPTIPIGVQFFGQRKRPYLSFITFFGCNYYLYDYLTKEEASMCYQSVQASRDEIGLLWQVEDSTSEQTKLLRSYVSNPAPAKVYSSEFTGVSWSNQAKKWCAVIEFTVTISGKKTRVAVKLGYFVKELEAKYVRDCVNDHRTEIKSLLKDTPDSVERTALVKSFIPKHIDIE